MNRVDRPEMLLRMRADHLKRRYGLSLADYDKMYQQQIGGCAICTKRSLNSTGKRLAVDHNHRTNQVRGLLCSRCNAYLAWYEEFAAQINDYLLLTEGGGDC